MPTQLHTLHSRITSGTSKIPITIQSYKIVYRQYPFCCILLIGLYSSVQPVFGAIIKRLFPQRASAVVVAEMPNGEQVAVPANDESVGMMQFTSEAPTMEYEVSGFTHYKRYGNINLTSSKRLRRNKDYRSNI